MKDLLNVLYDHYNAQLPLGTVMPYGWTIVEVNYAVEVNDDGELTGIYALGATSDADEVEDKAKTKAKGKDTPYQKFTVPVRRRQDKILPRLRQGGSPPAEGEIRPQTAVGRRQFGGEKPLNCKHSRTAKATRQYDFPHSPEIEFYLST